MAVLARAVAGVLLLAHGLVHLLYLAPDARDPDYAFTLQTSWIVPARARRPVALVLMVATVATFTALALAVWGVKGLAAAWPGIAAAAAAVSLVLLAAFWDVRLIFGVVLDLALLTLVVVRPGWVERLAG